MVQQVHEDDFNELLKSSPQKKNLTQLHSVSKDNEWDTLEKALAGGTVDAALNDLLGTEASPQPRVERQLMKEVSKSNPGNAKSQATIKYDDNHPTETTKAYGRSHVDESTINNEGALLTEEDFEKLIGHIEKSQPQPQNNPNPTNRTHFSRATVQEDMDLF